MSKQFFITGLPRSRTAWFANLFTWGDSICYHDGLCPEDGLCLVSSFDHLLKRLKEGNGPRGHSCASNILVWRKLHKEFPDAKWVFVSRDGGAIIDSVSKILKFDVEQWNSMSNEAMVMIKEIGPMVVHFDCIDPVGCYGISNHLGIDIGPAARVRQLCDMNIQIHPPILKRRLESLKCQQLVDTKEAA